MVHHQSFLDVFASVWLILGGVFMSLGVFLPKFRMARTKCKNRGQKLSAPEQLVWSLAFIGWGVYTLVS